VVHVAYVSGTDDHSSLLQVTDGLFIDVHCRIGANQLHTIIVVLLIYHYHNYYDIILDYKQCMVRKIQDQKQKIYSTFPSIFN
jgi:hypothetical protein